MNATADAYWNKQLAEALNSLVEAIDFEGERGRIQFNPGTIYEDERLTRARAVLSQAMARSES